jgi:MFS family permease
MPDFSISTRTPFFVTAKKLFLDKKLKIFLNFFVGPILFVWLSYSIYQQIQRQADVHQSWELIKAALIGPQSWKLVLVIIFMLVNWGIEARKWQVLVGSIQQVSFRRAYRAVFSGQALAFNTINRVGESAGRAVYLEEGNRIRGIVLSVVGSMSQIIVTFVLGLLGLLYLRFAVMDADHEVGISAFWINVLIYTISGGTILFILLFFRISWAIRLLEKIPFVQKHKFFVQKLEDFHPKELTRILFLSFCRYVVFVVQYVLLLQVFEVSISFTDAACMVGVMFLLLAIVPTIALAELGFRGKLSLQLFGLFSTNTVGIVATAAGIWIINLIIPAIAGSLFILGIRLFRK